MKILGLVLAFVLLPLVPVQAVTVSTSTSQALTPIVVTTQQVHTLTPGQFTPDLGSNTLQTTPKGFSIYRPGGNVSVGAVAETFNGQSIALSNPPSLVPQGLSNSTVTEYLYDQTVTVGPDIYHAHLELYLKRIAGSYDVDLIPKGSMQFNGAPANPGTLLIQITNPQALPVSDCNPSVHTITINGTQITVRACTKQLFGNMGIDWSTSNYPVSYNNSTQTLSYSVPASFLIDPIAVDSSANVAWNGGNTKSVSITTSASPDVIYVVTTGLTFSSFGVGSWAVSDSASSLTFHNRVYLQDTTCPGGNCGTEFTACAIASGTLSADSITVTITGHNLFGGQLSVYAISGANTSGCTSSTFDPNGAIPCSAVQDGVGAGRCTISTSNANDMLLGGAWNDGGQGLSAPTAPASWNDDYNNVVNSRSNDAAHLVVSSTQSSVNIDWGNWQSNNGVVFVDAIQQAAASQVTLIVTLTISPVGAPNQGSVTITGCTPSPSSIAIDGASHNIMADPTCSITFTVGADSVAGTKDRFSNAGVASTTWVFTTPASGSQAKSNTVYHQLHNTYKATPVGPTVWDAVYSVTVKGTILGVASSTGCTISTTSGGGAAQCGPTDFDYHLTVTVLGSFGSWAPFPAGSNTFTDTTSGNTDNVNYVIAAPSSSTDYLLLAVAALAVMPLMLIIPEAERRVKTVREKRQRRR